MKRFTLIKKCNKIIQFDYVDGIMIDEAAIVVERNGKIVVNIGNPITWPADASDGLQAIVDVKAGTLRFGYDGWPWAATEFVVSNYSESVEDSDPVNRPSHYTAGGIECIDAIKSSMSTEAFLGFLKGNVQKYMWRYEKKVAPVEDLKKAQWYLSKLIEEQELS